MTKQIWKFPIPIDDEVVVSMPEKAVILSVQAQNDTPCIWAIVDVDAKRENRTFSIVGTGHSMKEWESFERVYLGTFQCIGGAFVGHLFELIFSK